MLKCLFRTIFLAWFMMITALALAASFGNSPVLLYIASANNETDIYFYDIFSSIKLNFTNTAYPEWRGTWSQNRVFAYTASYSETEADGLFVSHQLSPPRLISSLPYSFIFGARLSPNGQSLIYVSSEPANYSEIYLLSMADEQQENLSQSPKLSETAPQWFPDGDAILYLLDGNVYRLNIQTRLSSLILDSPQNFTNADLSPDGNWLALDHSSNIAELWLFNISSQELLQIPLPDVPIGDAFSWSPDSKVLTFAIADGRLMLYQIEEEQLQIFQGEGRRIQPSFSSDGRYIAFLENRQIFVLEWQTGQVFPIHEHRQIRPPFLWMP